MRLLCFRRATGNQAYIWFFFWNFGTFSQVDSTVFGFFGKLSFEIFASFAPKIGRLRFNGKFSRLLVSFYDRTSVDGRGKRWIVGHNCLFLCAKSKKSNSIQEPEQVRENCERSQTFQRFSLGKLLADWFSLEYPYYEATFETTRDWNETWTCNSRPNPFSSKPSFCARIREKTDCDQSAFLMKFMRDILKKHSGM